MLLASAYAKQSPKLRCRMTTFAEIARRLAHHMRLLDGYRLDHDARSKEQRITLLAYFNAKLVLDYQSQFDEIRS